MKKTVSITVDCPDEFECTGEYRVPKVGEACLSPGGVVHKQGMFCDRVPGLIVREKWQAPSWIPKWNWVYFSPAGFWYVAPGRPWTVSDYNPARWTANESVRVDVLAKINGDTFTPPPVNCLQVC